MEAIIKADQQRGPGHGIIAIAGAGQFQQDQVQAPTFVLQRAEDKKYLAASGSWQESASPLRPDAWQASDGVLHLAVGPALVNEMDMLGAYRIQLTGNEGNEAEHGQNVQACVLAVGQLVYSDMGGGQGIVGAEDEKTPQSAKQPAKPESRTEQQDKPEETEPAEATEPDAQPEQTPLPEAQPQPEKGAENGQAAEIESLSMDVEQKKPGSGNGLATLVVLAILGLLAWAGWSWLQKGSEEGARPLPPIGQQGKKNPPLPDPRATGNKADSQTAAKTSGKQNAGSTGNALALAREHLRGSADPAASLALAKPLRTAEASPEQADASFLLLEDAAQKGQAEAMYLLAQFYDPVATLPRGSIPTDMEQARHWYARAAEKGVSQADKALKDLHDHASREARQGNAIARRLLREWKQQGSR